MLIVEDLVLLLMDDESGTPAAAGTLYSPWVARCWWSSPWRAWGG